MFIWGKHIRDFDSRPYKSVISESQVSNNKVTNDSHVNNNKMTNDSQADTVSQKQ